MVRPGKPLRTGFPPPCPQMIPHVPTPRALELNSMAFFIQTSPSTHDAPADKVVGLGVFYQRPQLGEKGRDVTGVAIHRQGSGRILHRFCSVPTTLLPYLCHNKMPFLPCAYEGEREREPYSDPGRVEETPTCFAPPLKKNKSLQSAVPLALSQAQHNGRAWPNHGGTKRRMKSTPHLISQSPE